jgi:isopentenyl diphosphate isomerase/L-lactate dehydrogenase-like FMN-dependent dehydrogenase
MVVAGMGISGWDTEDLISASNSSTQFSTGDLPTIALLPAIRTNHADPARV